MACFAFLTGGGDLGLQMPKKLTYFGIYTPVCMPCQCLLEMSGKPYEGKSITFEEWTELKPKTPNGCLPMADMPDGSAITESGAIGRTIAGSIGLLGKGKDFTTSEMLVGMTADLHTKIMKLVPTIVTVGEYGREKKAAYVAGKEDVMNFVAKFKPYLSESGDRFTSSGLTFGEVDLFCKLYCYVQGPYPEMAKGDLAGFYSRMLEVPGIKRVVEGKSQFGTLGQYLLAPP